MTATLDAAVERAGYVTYVAETDRVVGMLVADRSPTGVAWVRWLAVAADVRRRRVGTALLQRFHRDGEPDRIEGRVEGSDPVATAFWTAQGRTPQARRRHIWTSAASDAREPAP